MRIRAVVSLLERENSWSVSEDYKLQSLYAYQNNKLTLIASIHGTRKVIGMQKKMIAIEISQYSIGAPIARYWCHQIYDSKGHDLLPKLMMQKLAQKMI